METYWDPPLTVLYSGLPGLPVKYFNTTDWDTCAEFETNYAINLKQQLNSVQAEVTSSANRLIAFSASTVFLITCSTARCFKVFNDYLCGDNASPFVEDLQNEHAPDSVL